MSEESGEHIYAYPVLDRVYLLFRFPDGYIGVTTVQHVANFASIAGGSQMVDHLLRSMSRS